MMVTIWIPPSATKDDNVAADGFDFCLKLQDKDMVERFSTSCATADREMKRVLDAEKNALKGTNLVDCFGLTPLQIVATCSGGFEYPASWEI